MKIHIENVAKIKSADVKLNGLTLIAGENGSGKSTVGKMLFSVVQVLKNIRIDNEQKRKNILEKHIRTLYTRLGGFRTTQYCRESLPMSWFQLMNILISETMTIEELRDIVNNITSNSENVSLRTKANIDKDIKNIEACISKSNTMSAVQATYIQSIVESEFMNSVCSIGSKCSKVSYAVEESDDSRISFEVKDNVVTDNVQVNGSGFIQDATYIESPLYLHMLESLGKSIQYVEVDNKPTFWGMIPTHIMDFVEKMNFAKSVLRPSSDYPDVLNSIEGIIDGSFQFDKNNNRLFYVSKDNSYSPINTASGTKTFGVMQLLLQNNLIGPNRIMIWDEPENHLHPQWQIAFAEVLIQLILKGIPIVISTHSPYFLQAVRYYAAKYGAERSVDYYFAEEKEDGLSVISEVTNDLNKIFTKLSRPLNEVMNVDQVRKHE